MSSQIELPGATDWVRHAPAHAELESIEAFFSGHAFDPHRHATYAIGRTLAGVQSFSYRGARTNSLPGETMILHPDEVHDGRAGAADGFRYRMLYLPPTLVQDILGGRPLPFHRESVSRDPRLARATEAVFAALDAQSDVLARDDALYGLVATLAEVCQAWPSRGRVDFAAALRAREYLEDHLDQAVTLDDLARCAGRDRWSLTRDFRAYFGTSPHRYLTLRRLDQVRLQVRLGRGLAEAAVAAGFYDQSHMTKHFRQAFGVAPARWFRGLAGAPGATVLAGVSDP
ncbi:MULTISPECIES: AraC family transcriptional regulator [Pseudomonadaceae]|jgi:AraC-like DNA-binding protein|uniref:AraC family transcriptional regulator n=1 Tax=Ectopseudomonas oleovorans TaxID=301 RepID=A0A3D9EPR3_ECTOL|nr:MULTISPECIES: AraC family transcriptional regulator [Pseudomonas]RED04325.1 AraC family transcriptional regulator [Pseudomonas oleovorans]